MKFYYISQVGQYGWIYPTNEILKLDPNTLKLSDAIYKVDWSSGKYIIIEAAQAKELGIHPVLWEIEE